MSLPKAQPIASDGAKNPGRHPRPGGGPRGDKFEQHVKRRFIGVTFKQLAGVVVTAAMGCTVAGQAQQCHGQTAGRSEAQRWALAKLAEPGSGKTGQRQHQQLCKQARKPQLANSILTIVKRIDPYRLTCFLLTSGDSAAMTC